MCTLGDQPFVVLPGEAKPAFYARLREHCRLWTEGEQDCVTNTANVAAILHDALLWACGGSPARRRRGGAGTPNWTGFYLIKAKQPPAAGEELVARRVPSPSQVLGPFQGLAAKRRIDFSKGVCGACAREGRTQLVPDVHQFPGHIACDSRSNSEVVVPLRAADGRLVAVLDMDCPNLAGFDEVRPRRRPRRRAGGPGGAGGAGVRPRPREPLAAGARFVCSVR